MKTNLNSILQKLHPLLKRLVGESVHLELDLEPTPGTVCVDRTQWEQVLVNLALNARDAMNGRGSLRIETRTRQVDQPIITPHADVPPGMYAILNVCDTGCGMDRNVLDHLFEPFFTTKPAGKGSGLGLATVYGIVEQSGGHIIVESMAGKGSMFSLYLPVIGEAVAPEPQRVPPPIPTGTETVLVVEDEPGVRAWVRHALGEMGYKVLDAGSPEDALRIADSHHGKIHLLLTDVMMPRMIGPELAHLVLGRRPELKVLYMSGYADDSTFPADIREEGMVLLKKPFTASALACKVRKVLDTISS